MSHIQRSRLATDLYPFALAGTPGGCPAAAPPALAGRRAAAKRALDLVLAAVLLMLLAAPMVAIALLVRCDSRGPVLFRQRRIGLHGRDFRLLKFRTMHAATADGFCVQARRRDPRVTRVGAWLRRLSIDEWPQLINVLRGEMSLVGPRPHAPGTCAAGRPFEQITASYAARHQVRPGITGLAQVRGWRGETETEDKLRRRVECDLEYIETWSIGLDFVILLRTLPAVLRTTNAY